MIKKLDVYYHDSLVGQLALSANKQVVFQYSDYWLNNGFSISPFSLPLRKEVFVPSKTHFNGLFGVFADSLPDAWGNLLIERYWSKHYDGELGVMERLAIVGNHGLGGLTYRPAFEYNEAKEITNIENIHNECKAILDNESIINLEELYALGGSSGGTRPKVMGIYEGNQVIIKFPAKVDRPDIGQLEYDYSKCATKCGINMAKTFYIPSNHNIGYFGTYRFDRNEDGSTNHIISAAALLEANYEQPCLDYSALFKLTKILTHDNKDDIENLFLRMCFNIISHNQDDHAKNFAYIYDEKHDMYRLAPAFDLTYSTTYFNEHTTSVNNQGNPTLNDLINVGIKAGLSERKCLELYKIVKENIQNDLRKYLE